MFRLHKIKSDRLSLGERIDFRISHFKALQVPRGWDKLYVTVISVETGKTIARLSKAVVRSGSCQWEENFTESVWVSPEDSSKELEDCIFKFVVAMGSARSGILGEATVNMSSYISSSSSVSASFPLKKCDYATILQARIQCLTPIANARDVAGKGQILVTEVEETKSDQESDTVSPKSPASYCSSETGSPGLETQEAGSSATNSPRSDDSEEISTNRPGLFPSKPNQAARRGKRTSSGNSVSRSNNYFTDSPRSDQSLPARRIPARNMSSQDGGGSLRITDSPTSQTFLEAAEETIGDLRKQAKMWERTARKVMLEMDFLKKEHVELSRSQGNQNMEFSEACAERDGLRKEVEQLKQMLAKAKMKPPPLDNPNEGSWQLVKELEREISFQKQSNGNLTVQLKRSQQSNVELVDVLQDLEETLEKQKVEIESLYDMESRFGELEDAMEASSESNRNLMAQVLKLEESEKALMNKVHELEMAMEEGNREVASINRVRELTEELGEERRKVDVLETGLGLKEAEIQELQRCKQESEARVSIIEKEKGQIEADLEMVTRENEIASRCLNDLQNDLATISSKLDAHVSDNKSLERKSFELERSKQEMELCLSELRQENEDLSVQIFKLENRLRSEAKDHESKICDLKEELKKTESEFIVSAQETGRLKLELEVKVTGLSNQLDESKAEINSLETIMRANEEEIRHLETWKTELEANLSIVQEEKDRLEERMEAIMTENDIATRRSNELQSELTSTRTSVDRHVSANENLERKSLELENQKNTLVQQLSGIEQDNRELLMRITDLETQLRLEASDHESQLNSIEENKKKLIMQIDSDYNASLEKVESMRVDLEAEVAELKAELSDRKAEIEILDACLHAKEEEIGQHQRHARESEEKMFDLEHERCKVEKKMETLMEENDVAARRLNELQEDIMKLTSSVESHVALNVALETKCSELEVEIGHHQRHAAELEPKIFNLEHEKREQEQKMEKITEENDIAARRLNELEQETLKLTSSVEYQVASNKALETKCSELEEEIGQHQRQARESEAKILNLEHEKSELEQKMETIMEENDIAERRLNDFQQDIMKLTSNAESQVASNNALETKCSKLEEEIEQHQRNARELEAKISHLEHDKCELQQNMGTIMEENEVAAKCLNDSQHEIMMLTGRIESHVASNNALKTKCSELEEEIGKHQRHARDSEAKIVDLEHEKSELEKKMKTMMEENDVAARRLNDFQQDIMMLTSSVECHVASNTALETKCSELKEEIRQHQKHARESKAKISDLELEKCQLKQNMESIMEENDVAARRLNDSQQEIMMLITSVESHVASTNTLKTKCSELEEEKEQHQRQARESEAEIFDLEHEKCELEKKMETIMEENDVAARRLNELQQNITMLRSSVESHVAWNNALKTKCSELEEEIEQHQRHTRESEAKISDLEEEKSQLQQNMETIMEENSVAARRLNDSQQEIIMLQSRVESHVASNNALDTICSALKDEIGQHQRHGRESEAKISNLEQEKSQLQQNMETIMEENGIATRRLNDSEQEIMMLQSRVESHVALNNALETKCSELEVEIGQHQRYRKESKAKIFHLENEKSKLEQKMEIIVEENDVAATRLNELQQDIMVLTSSVESHVASNNALEMKCSKLEGKEQELQLHFWELKQENEQLATRLSEMEAQLRSETAKLESLMRVLEEKEEQLKEVESKYNFLSQELENDKKKMEVTVSEHFKELTERMAEIKGLESVLQSKEEEIGNLQMCRRESESELVALEKEKNQLEHNMERVLRENVEARNRLKDLHSRIDYHFLAKEIPESENKDLQPHISERTVASQGLLSFISELEAKMLHLQTERESTEVELENFKFTARSLKDEMARLSNEIETERMNLKNPLQQIKNECLAAHEENECLNEENQKLQATAEGFREGCEALLVKNEELGKKNTDIENHISYLEVQLKKAQLSLDEFSKRVVNLGEENELQQNENQKQLATTEALREDHKAILAKNEELGKRNNYLQNQCSHLEEKLTSTQLSLDEFTERVKYLEDEICSLEQDRASKVKGLTSKLHTLLEEFEERAETQKVTKPTTSEMEFRMEAESMKEELASFKENLEMLESENRRTAHLLADYKSTEAKLRTTINELELRLTVSDYDREVLKEGAMKLKAQLLKLGPVHLQVLGLENELNAAKSEKEKLKYTLNLVTRECQQLQAEKSSLADEIAELQKFVYQLEEHKRQRVTLEEKLKNTERDLMAKEAMWERDQQVNGELNKIRKANKQLRKRMEELEDEKEECSARARSLEEELVMIHEEVQMDRNLSSSNMDFANYDYPDEDENFEQDTAAAGSFEQQLSKSRSAKSSLRTNSRRFASDAGKQINDGEATMRRPLTRMESRFDYAESSLERELRDIRERYLHMSMKYAEVEAQREELVTKLRSSGNGNVVETGF